MLKSYQEEFLHFAIESGALRFGEFTLKSGRISPYFFNAGEFNTGSRIARLGRFYAAAIADAVGHDFMLFGPAYKGIPLVTTTAVALADEFDRDVGFAFNRKEAKDHGEGGQVVGAPLAGEVLIVDDVVTAGLSVGESIALIRAAGATPAGVVIALDRTEKALDSGNSAVQQIEQEYAMPVIAIVKLTDLIGYLENTASDLADLTGIMRYREQYGV